MFIIISDFFTAPFLMVDHSGIHPCNLSKMCLFVASVLTPHMASGAIPPKNHWFQDGHGASWVRHLDLLQFDHPSATILESGILHDLTRELVGLPSGYD